MFAPHDARFAVYGALLGERARWGRVGYSGRAFAPARGTYAGLDGARDGLLLYVAHVGERKAVAQQGLVEVPQRAAGFHGDEPCSGVHRADRAQAVRP